MVRWMWACALVAVVLGLVGGCESKPNGAQGPVEITFWYAYGGKNREVTEAMIRDFQKARPDIKVKATFQGDYFESLAKLRVAARTDHAPVVTHVIGEALPELHAKGMLEPLDGYADGAVVGASKLDRADFIPALTQEGAFETYGQPVPLVSLPFNRSTPILYYNEAMLKQAGVEPPKTWDELKAVCEKLTVLEGGEVSRWCMEVPVDWWFWYAMLHQAGGALLSPDGTQATFGQGPGQEAVKLWQELIAAKHMRVPAGRDYNAWQVANADFINQKVAMVWTSTAFLAYFEENAKFPFKTAFLPGKVKQAVPTGGTFFVILKNAPEPQKKAAWEFIRWMTEPPQTARWAKETGYMPVRKSALELPELKQFYAQHPDYTTALKQLDHAVKFPFKPALLEIERNLLQPGLEKIFRDGAAESEVLPKAATEADKLLKAP